MLSYTETEVRIIEGMRVVLQRVTEDPQYPQLDPVLRYQIESSLKASQEVLI